MGVRSTNLPQTSLADEVLVNRGGTTSTQPLQNLSQQLSSSGALADRMAMIETTSGLVGYRFVAGGPVAAATLANTPLTGEQEIDGVTTSNTRVLVKDQSDPAENGIYETSSGAWSRAADFDAASDAYGAAVFVLGGGENADKTFLCYSDVANLGEDGIHWTEGPPTDRAAAHAARLAAESAAESSRNWAQGTSPGGPGTKSAMEHTADAGAFALLTAADADATAADRVQTGLDRAAAGSSAAQALAEKSQAELAALLAQGQLVSSLTTPTPAEGTIEAIASSPGLLVYRVESGAWSDPAYLGPLSFAQRTGPIVDLITALPTGTVAEMAGLKYIVDSAATGTASAAYDLGKDGLRPFGTPEPGHFGDDIKRAIEYKSGYTNALELPIGAWTLSSGADITAYSHITGKGDQSQIFVPAGQKGIKYTSQTGVHDDHPTNVHKDFRITGDGVLAAYPGAQNGTTVGVSYAEVPGRANLASAEGMSFELHAVGRHIKESYGQSGRNNYYRANKIGLKLELVTSYTEYDIYARYNSDVAVQILGGQNVSFVGGAIEGSIGKALEFITNPAYLWGQLNLYNVYFELNGDQAGGVESIDIPFGSNTMVNIIGGNYWTNAASGKISGPYRLGDSLLMDGATINARFYAKEVVGFRNCRGPGLGGWNCMATEALSRLFGLEEPALFHEFRPTSYEHVFSSGATGGLIIGTKVVGRGSTISPVFANLATLSYPYGITASAGAVAAENAALDYGEGSYQQVQFAASVGSFSSNYATLASYADTTKPFRTTCVLIQPEDDCELGFVQSVGGQSITGYYRFEAGKTYRLVLAAQAPMTAGSFLRVFPLDDTGPAVNFHMHWMSQSASYREQLKIIELLVDGLL